MPARASGNRAGAGCARWPISPAAVSSLPPPIWRSSGGRSSNAQRRCPAIRLLDDSPVWQAQRDRIHSLFPEEECSRYIAPLRGQEQDGILWLEAPNQMVAAWVAGRLPHIIETLQPYTDLPVQIRVG